MLPSTPEVDQSASAAYPETARADNSSPSSSVFDEDAPAQYSRLFDKEDNATRESKFVVIKRRRKSSETVS